MKVSIAVSIILILLGIATIILASNIPCLGCNEAQTQASQNKWVIRAILGAGLILIGISVPIITSLVLIYDLQKKQARMQWRYEHSRNRGQSVR